MLLYWQHFLRLYSKPWNFLWAAIQLPATVLRTSPGQLERLTCGKKPADGWRLFPNVVCPCFAQKKKKKKVDKHESHFWPLENSVKEGPLQAPAWGFPSTEQNTRLNLYKKYSWPFYADGCSTLGKQGGTSWVIWTKLVLHIIFSLKDIWDLAPHWNSMCWKWRTQPCSLKKTFSRDKYFTMYIELDDQVLSGEENMFGLKILDLFQVITKGSLVK